MFTDEQLEERDRVLIHAKAVQNHLFKAQELNSKEKRRKGRTGKGAKKADNNPPHKVESHFVSTSILSKAIPPAAIQMPP
jgi:hypothetical protein